MRAMLSQIRLALLPNKLIQTFWRLLSIEALPAHVLEDPLGSRFRFPAYYAHLAFSSPARIAEQLAALKFTPASVASADFPFALSSCASVPRVVNAFSVTERALLGIEMLAAQARRDLFLRAMNRAPQGDA